MEGGESKDEKRIEVERRVVEKVGFVISSIVQAKRVDQVIVALYSLAVHLFPLHPDSLSGSIDEQYRDELLAVEVPTGDEKTEWWNVFYKGSAFPAFARVLLYDVASDWLACFPASARKQLYDAFFLDGCATEVVQVVVPCLQRCETGRYDASAVCSSGEDSKWGLLSLTNISHSLDYWCFAFSRMTWYFKWRENLVILNI